MTEPVVEPAVAPTEHVLVTGACGLVGRAVVADLLDRRIRVTASDLDTPANHKVVAAHAGRRGFATAWSDLTDADGVRSLLAAHAPTAVVHPRTRTPTCSPPGRRWPRTTCTARTSSPRSSSSAPARWTGWCCASTAC